jgi:hypothetical protein
LRTIVVLSSCFTIRFTGLSTNSRTFVAYIIASVIPRQKHRLKLVPFSTSLTRIVSTSPCQTQKSPYTRAHQQIRQLLGLLRTLRTLKKTRRFSLVSFQLVTVLALMHPNS